MKFPFVKKHKDGSISTDYGQTVITRRASKKQKKIDSSIFPYSPMEETFIEVEKFVAKIRPILEQKPYYLRQLSIGYCSDILIEIGEARDFIRNGDQKVIGPSCFRIGRLYMQILNQVCETEEKMQRRRNAIPAARQNKGPKFCHTVFLSQAIDVGKPEAELKVLCECEHERRGMEFVVNDDTFHKALTRERKRRRGDAA